MTASVNVNEMYSDVLMRLKVAGVKNDSRNGAVISLESPFLATVYRPTERVLFCPKRKANPYFHVMEAIWMLGGGQDVGWLKDFNKQIATYAEDDGKINGAYGYRWRMNKGWGDQLMFIIRELTRDRNSRQAVLVMYDPRQDHDHTLRDRPCNTHIYFRVRHEMLDMTVCNRSNDAVWGMCGANFVHMTYLQEFIARALKLRVGRYHVMTNNLHIYEPHWPLMDSPKSWNYYQDESMTSFPVYEPTEESPWEFLLECEQWNKLQAEGWYKSSWINHVVLPMYEHYMCRLNGDKHTYDINENLDPAWRLAENLWREWHD